MNNISPHLKLLKLTKQPKPQNHGSLLLDLCMYSIKIQRSHRLLVKLYCRATHQPHRKQVRASFILPQPCSTPTCSILFHNATIKKLDERLAPTLCRILQIDENFLWSFLYNKNAGYGISSSWKIQGQLKLNF